MRSRASPTLCLRRGARSASRDQALQVAFATENFIIAEMARKKSGLDQAMQPLWNDPRSPPESSDFPDTYVRFRGCGMLDLPEGVLYLSPRRWGLTRA